MPIARYGGRQKTTDLVKRNYQWPGVINNIGKYVDKYNMCQRIKNRIETLVGNLIVNKILEKQQIYLTVEFITKLLLVAENNTILALCNRLFKIVHFTATIEEILVKGLIRLFRDNMWNLYRLPESMISNRELQFVLELMKKLNKISENYY